ncbi:(Fe-S)-binding protein [Planctomycetales bacterium ZRK34]|nr:(Fe-S)-binding protein [Planctomycetales bacterium ZRK34]
MKVSLFVTCLTDTFYPRVGEAVVRVLEHLGCEVDFPEQQTCCGQPMYNTGCHKDAADLARGLIDAFENSDIVVTPSGSCCAMVRDYYNELLADDPVYAERSKAFVAKTYEFAEFLLNVLKVDLSRYKCTWGGGQNGDQTVKTTYHYSCHLRGLGMTDETVRLLGMIKGVDYVPLEKIDQCCGFGGTFAVKYPEISGTMVRDKVDCIQRSGARVLVCNDGGCALNITGSLHREGVPMTTKHIAEIIAEGLGLMPIEQRSNDR